MPLILPAGYIGNRGKKAGSGGGPTPPPPFTPSFLGASGDVIESTDMYAPYEIDNEDYLNKNIRFLIGMAWNGSSSRNVENIFIANESSYYVEALNPISTQIDGSGFRQAQFFYLDANLPGPDLYVIGTLFDGDVSLYLVGLWALISGVGVDPFDQNGTGSSLAISISASGGLDLGQHGFGACIIASREDSGGTTSFTFPSPWTELADDQLDGPSGGINYAFANIVNGTPFANVSLSAVFGNTEDQIAIAGVGF